MPLDNPSINFLDVFLTLLSVPPTPSDNAEQHSKSHARFEVKAAGWDDKPITRGTTELVKDWIVAQVGCTPRRRPEKALVAARRVYDIFVCDTRVYDVT